MCSSDLFPSHDNKYRVPRYYDGLLAKHFPYEHDDVKERRVVDALSSAQDSTDDRLAVKEFIVRDRISTLSRNFEVDVG